MGIGMTELILVFVVALIVIGPDKLPQYAKKFGEAMAAFRTASDEATKEIKKNIVEPLEEAQRPLREAMEPVEELNQAVKGNLKDVQKSINGIGKKRPASGPDAENRAKSPPPAPEADRPPETPETPEAAQPEQRPSEEHAQTTQTQEGTAS